jgi:hypothetical protein
MTIDVDSEIHLTTKNNNLIFSTERQWRLLVPVLLRHAIVAKQRSISI